MDLRPEISLQLEEEGGTRILTSDNRVKYSGKDSLAGQSTEVKYNTLIVPRGGEFFVGIGRWNSGVVECGVEVALSGGFHG